MANYLDPYVAHKDACTNTRHAQCVYLHDVLHFTVEKIAEITEYAVSSVKRFVKQCKHLLDYAIRKFGEPKKRRSAKNYECSIRWKVEYQPKTPCAYVVSLLDDNHNIVFTKVGKANDARERFLSILKTAKYVKDYNITNMVVHQLYYCESEDDALTVENELRKSYKNTYPNFFIRNDRFRAHGILDRDELVCTFDKIYDCLNVQTAPAIA